MAIGKADRKSSILLEKADALNYPSSSSAEEQDHGKSKSDKDFKKETKKEKKETISTSPMRKKEVKEITEEHAVLVFEPDPLYLGHVTPMLSDTMKHVRELGLRRILKCRESKTGSNVRNIRQFVIPKLNFEADDDIYLINCNSKDKSFIITEPPLTTSISDDELKK
ncbi:hypothetical protein ILUMI_03305 [Ignelater luminosus]|uniref:Uncharacterized protein n=1 Tax=Ignelater luminosus TaxID=2038154 RepID=A0A8K0DET5_IGNLU|nr:hypothetical protein ILUMI_03305 [Ignelater luminosus]